MAMDGVVKVVRVMGVEVVWLGVLRGGATGELAAGQGQGFSLTPTLSEL